MTANSPALRDPQELRLLEALEGCGAVTATSLELFDPEIPYDQWAALGYMIGRVRNSASWWLGEWLIYGEGVHKERFTQAASETGLQPQTLTNLMSVCRRIPRSVRREGCSFSVHSEVAALKPNAQRHWLARAERERLTREELRGLLREERTEDLPLGETTGRTDNGGPPSGEAQAAAGRSPVGSSVDAVLAAIRAVTSHAVPLDARTVAVRRKDLENLQAFLGDE